MKYIFILNPVIFRKWWSSCENVTKRIMVWFWSLSVKANSLQENSKLIGTGMQHII